MGAGESIIMVAPDLLIIVSNVYIRKSLQCMSLQGSVVCLTALVLVFGDQGPYIGRMQMRRCKCHNLSSGIVSGFRVAFGIVVRVQGLGEVMAGRLVGALYAVAVDSSML
jgi:hypothetical protein